MDTSKIRDVEVEGINMRDWPDLVDAHVAWATWEDGTPLTEDELDELNEKEYDFVYEQILNKIF